MTEGPTTLGKAYDAWGALHRQAAGAGTDAGLASLSERIIALELRALSLPVASVIDAWRLVEMVAEPDDALTNAAERVIARAHAEARAASPLPQTA